MDSTRSEVRRVGRTDIFFCDGFCFCPDPAHQELPGVLGGCSVPLLGSIHQAEIAFLGKLAVDGEPDGVPALIGQPDRKLHPLTGTGNDLHVFRELTGRQGFTKEISQLHLPPDSPGLDIRHDLFQISDAGGNALHLTHALID